MQKTIKCQSNSHSKNSCKASLTKLSRNYFHETLTKLIDLDANSMGIQCSPTRQKHQKPIPNTHLMKKHVRIQWRMTCTKIVKPLFHETLTKLHETPRNSIAEWKACQKSEIQQKTTKFIKNIT